MTVDSGFGHLLAESSAGPCSGAPEHDVATRSGLPPNMEAGLWGCKAGRSCAPFDSVAEKRHTTACSVGIIPGLSVRRAK